MKSEGFKVIAIAFVLTSILTWPFILNITSYYTDSGDYPVHGSILWWNQDSIKTGRIFHPQEYWRGYIFYPHPYSLAFTNNHVFPTLFFAPIYWLTQNLPFAINAYVFLTFILTFVSAFYFISYFVKDKLGSIIGAFIFTFNPQTMVRFPQHIELLGKYFLPLIFLFAYRILSKPNFKDAFWLFLFITFNSLTANYFQIFVYILLPISALPFLITKLWKKNWGYFLKLGKVSLVGLIFIPILLYFNLPFWDFSQKEGAFRSVSESFFFSARITDWFATTTNNLVYGGWSRYVEQFRQPKDDRGILNYEEHTLFLGLLAPFLFFVGLKYFKKQPIIKSFFLILLLTSFILCFGPFIPSYYLFAAIPLMKGIRAPTRFEYIMLAPFALIAAFGAKRLMEKKDIKIIIFTTIIVILVLENFTFKDFTNRSVMLKKAVDFSGKLAFLQNSVTLHLPVYTISDADIFGKNSIYTNWLTQTHEKTVNGNSGYLPPDILALLYQTNDNLDQSALQRLALLKVNFLIIHKDLMTAQELDKLAKSQSLLLPGQVFDDSGIEIIDLAKYNFKTSQCSLDQDFDVKLVEDALILSNKADCFLVSIYDDRYRKIAGAFFKVPILIGPKEQIVLNESSNELKIR